MQRSRREVRFRAAGLGLQVPLAPNITSAWTLTDIPWNLGGWGTLSGLCWPSSRLLGALVHRIQDPTSLRRGVWVLGPRIDLIEGPLWYWLRVSTRWLISPQCGGFSKLTKQSGELWRFSCLFKDWWRFHTYLENYGDFHGNFWVEWILLENIHVAAMGMLFQIVPLIVQLSKQLLFFEPP